MRRTVATYSSPGTTSRACDPAAAPRVSTSESPSIFWRQLEGESVEQESFFPVSPPRFPCRGRRAGGRVRGAGGRPARRGQRPAPGRSHRGWACSGPAAPRAPPPPGRGGSRAREAVAATAGKGVGRRRCSRVRPALPRARRRAGSSAPSRRSTGPPGAARGPPGAPPAAPGPRSAGAALQVLPSLPVFLPSLEGKVLETPVPGPPGAAAGGSSGPPTPCDGPLNASNRILAREHPRESRRPPWPRPSPARALPSRTTWHETVSPSPRSCVSPRNPSRGAAAMRGASGGPPPRAPKVMSQWAPILPPPDPPSPACLVTVYPPTPPQARAARKVRRRLPGSRRRKSATPSGLFPTTASGGREASHVADTSRPRVGRGHRGKEPRPKKRRLKAASPKRRAGHHHLPAHLHRLDPGRGG